MAIQGYYREKHIRPAITPMVDKSESAVAMRKKREHNTHTETAGNSKSVYSS